MTRNISQVTGQETALLAKLSADPIRWHKTAQWPLYSLVQQGLMRDDSPRDIWASSDRGRRWLREH